jgi:hypothetical protein
MGITTLPVPKRQLKEDEIRNAAHYSSPGAIEKVENMLTNLHAS